jgi:hypothetical protein
MDLDLLQKQPVAFKATKQLEEGLTLFEVKYYEKRLNLLETLEDGQMTFQDRIFIQRKYVAPKTQKDSSFFDFVTKIEDVTIASKRASIALVHGLNQNQNTFFEMAL